MKRAVATTLAPKLDTYGFPEVQVTGRGEASYVHLNQQLFNTYQHYGIPILSI